MTAPRRAWRPRSDPWSKQNRPPKDQSWIWITYEMLGAPSWRAMSNAARLVVFRVTIEHASHAGLENGNLVVTYDDFHSYGIRRSSISGAIREAEALGFIKVTDRGRGGNSDFRKASRYGLGWLPTVDGLLAENRWRRTQTIGEAKATVLNAKRHGQRSKKAG